MSSKYAFYPLLIKSNADYTVLSLQHAIKEMSGVILLIFQ